MFYFSHDYIVTGYNLACRHMKTLGDTANVLTNAELAIWFYVERI